MGKKMYGIKRKYYKYKRFIFFLIFNISYLMFITGCSNKNHYKLDFDAKLKTKITQKEMNEDLKALKYLITTSYVAYDTAVENGFDIDKSLEEIRTGTLEKANAKGEILTSDFQRQIYEVFKNNIGISDRHFGVFGFNTYKTTTTKQVRWSGVYLEKIGDEYFVKKIADEKIDNIKIGAKYTGVEKNIFKTIFENEILYRYGVLTDVNLNTLTISLDGEQQTIQVQKQQEFTSIEGWTSVIETENSVYVALQTFNMISNKVDYKKFEELCDSLKTALPDKNLIIDFRPNTGGESTLASQLTASIYFPKSVNRDEHFKFYDFTLNEQSKFKKKIKAPAYEQCRKHFRKQINAMENRPDEYFRKDDELFPENRDDFEIYKTPSDYHGKIYILLSPKSASASEYATALMYLAKDADITLIGENSCGAVDFVAMINYPLPKSGIGIYIGMAEGAPPCISKNPHFMGEGNGFFPNYWVTNDNLLPALIYLTGDESLSEKLARIEKRQL